ncbi:MAG TPA: thioredoxin domain-containing protein [Labilithrix sp.]|jgi:predicted DsbA family dithiol-disulfide isomerase|nr:thioredoxin domain-containing protein [Labilithrix sp.]
MRLRAAVMIALVVDLLLACGGELPAVIRDDMAQTSRMRAGAATVVFFTDFQCPFCRRTHAALAPLVAARHDRVRVVVRHVPLARHPDARTAARAAVCVEAVTHRGQTWVAQDDYVHALFEARDLSEGACEELAVEHGVDRDRFQRCLSDPSTDARVEHDLAMFDAVRGDGVPLLFVGSRRLEGGQSSSSLEAAIDEALGGK